MDMNKKLEEICRLFRIEGTFVGYETIQVGNVNKTYECKFILPEGSPKSYLVQNVNTYAFRHPVELMDNIDKVTEHIRAKKPGQVALHFHHTADRKTYVIDGKNFWRMTNYISSTTYDTAENLDLIRNAGKAFGEFQLQLADFKPEDLFETIPDFHNTRSRYEKLIESAKADPVGRVAEVREELDWLLSVQDQACSLTDMLAEGKLTVRVAYCPALQYLNAHGGASKWNHKTTTVMYPVLADLCGLKFQLIAFDEGVGAAEFVFMEG